MVKKHRTAPHDGAAFLTWHSQFIVEFHDFLGNIPQADRPKPNDIIPWEEVPPRMKQNFQYQDWERKWNPDWDALEQKLKYDIASFNSLKELANKINPLHGFLHIAVGTILKEPYIADIEEAPRSTYFWQIHGLIERWHKAAKDNGIS